MQTYTSHTAKTINPKIVISKTTLGEIQNKLRKKGTWKKIEFRKVTNINKKI